MRIRDWSSDVCSSDLWGCRMSAPDTFAAGFEVPLHRSLTEPILLGGAPRTVAIANGTLAAAVGLGLQPWIPGAVLRSEEHTSELQSLMRISYAVFCLKKKKKKNHLIITIHSRTNI